MMSSVVARKGRHRQRYENNRRLVSGCIPYRLTKDVKDCGCSNGNTRENMNLQVLMVSSPNRDDLVFPKGGWEDNETREEAACREALEEAGVIGIIKETPLGDWEFRSKSKQEMINCCNLQEGACKGYMFALEVTEMLETWPEQQNRDRRWLTINEAFELCRYDWMREALDAFLKVMQAAVEIRKLDSTTDDKNKIEVGAECQVVISSSNSVSPVSVKAASSTTAPPVINHITSFTWHSSLLPLKRMAADMS